MTTSKTPLDKLREWRPTPKTRLEKLREWLTPSRRRSILADLFWGMLFGGLLAYPNWVSYGIAMGCIVTVLVHLLFDIKH